jgi:hypothetical protein
MNKDKALDLALEALELSSVTVDSFGVQRKTQEAITAIKQARSAPVQEPIAQDVQEKCRIEAVPAKGGLLPAAPVQEPAIKQGWDVDTLLDKPAAPVQETEVSWGVDWGRVGDKSCAMIIKRLPDGKIEVVAVEYEP